MYETLNIGMLGTYWTPPSPAITRLRSYRPVRIDMILDIWNNRPIFYGKCEDGVGEYPKKNPIFSHVGNPLFWTPWGP